MNSPEPALSIIVLPPTGWSRKILRLYKRKKTPEDRFYAYVSEKDEKMVRSSLRRDVRSYVSHSSGKR
jgi:hypothetical protein